MGQNAVRDGNEKQKRAEGVGGKETQDRNLGLCPRLAVAL